MDTDAAQTECLIANFVSVSIPVEEYLRHGRPLTAQELESVSLTITGLKTFLELWKRKNIVPPQPQSPT
jgi:hypothetical protein